MRAIIYIGLEKTGTTSFQRELARGADALASDGIHAIRSLDFPNATLAAPSCLSLDRTDQAFEKRNLADPTSRIDWSDLP